MWCIYVLKEASSTKGSYIDKWSIQKFLTLSSNPEHLRRSCPWQWQLWRRVFWLGVHFSAKTLRKMVPNMFFFPHFWQEWNQNWGFRFLYIYTCSSCTHRYGIRKLIIVAFEISLDPLWLQWDTEWPVLSFYWHGFWHKRRETSWF